MTRYVGIKDVQDTVGRDGYKEEAPENIFGDTFFQVTTKQPPEFAQLKNLPKLQTHTTAAVAMIAIVLSLLTGLWLGLVVTSQQSTVQQANKEVLGVNDNENIYQESDEE